MSRAGSAFSWRNSIFSHYYVGISTTRVYEGWNFNIGNYLFTTDTK